LPIVRIHSFALIFHSKRASARTEALVSDHAEMVEARGRILSHRIIFRNLKAVRQNCDRWVAFEKHDCFAKDSHDSAKIAVVNRHNDAAIVLEGGGVGVIISLK
jgi:hypothetical protein